MTINRAWPIVDVVCERLANGRDVSPEALKGVVKFLQGFFIEHHLPAEDALFQVALEHDMGRENSLVNKIIMEHEEAKSYVENIADTVMREIHGDDPARSALVENCREFIVFLVRHEKEEDEDLFPYIEKVLTEEELRELRARFEEDTDRNDQEPHRYYSLLLTDIEYLLGPDSR